MNGKCVRDLHFSHEDLVQVNGTSGVTASGIAGSAGLNTKQHGCKLIFSYLTCYIMEINELFIAWHYIKS